MCEPIVVSLTDCRTPQVEHPSATVPIRHVTLACCGCKRIVAQKAKASRESNICHTTFKFGSWNVWMMCPDIHTTLDVPRNSATIDDHLNALRAYMFTFRKKLF